MLQAFEIIVGVIVALGFLLFLLVLAIHIYVYFGLWVAGIRMRRNLAKKGRALSFQDARRLISGGEGTIFIEAPTLGWNVSRVWWAPTGILIDRPKSWGDEKSCPDEDQINYDNLIDEARGVARIVDIFVFTQRVDSYMRRHFGMAECPFIFTGGVLFERELSRRRAEKGPPNGGKR